MLILPLETQDHKQDVVVVILEPANLARMREGDPAEVKLRQVREAGKHLVEPTILLCYEEDTAALTRLVQGGDLRAMLKYLHRGWKFRLEAGDHDRGPEPYQP